VGWPFYEKISNIIFLFSGIFYWDRKKKKPAEGGTVTGWLADV
jgi:hypothetical protein